MRSITNYERYDCIKAKKDWKGDTHSVFVTHGASNHSKSARVDNDYYATDPKAVRLLLEQESFSQRIWECAVGGGHIADELKRHGYEVYCTDIVDRGYPGTEVLDFLEYKGEQQPLDIITNPPYIFAQRFVEKALDCVEDGHKVAMFLKLQFLEGKSRRKLFDTTPPQEFMLQAEDLIAPQTVTSRIQAAR